MNFIILYTIGLFGLLLSGWSFKSVLKIMINCVGITHCYGEHDRRTCEFIKVCRRYLRFYFVMLFAGITLIVISCMWAI